MIYIYHQTYSDFCDCYRYLYERAVVTRDYGVLLTKWDKREESGHSMIRDADIIFDMLALTDADDGDVKGSGDRDRDGDREMLTSMMLLPIEIYTSGV